MTLYRVQNEQRKTRLARIGNPDTTVVCPDIRSITRILRIYVRSNGSTTINTGFYDRNIQNGFHMMQKNTSKLVVKTVCEANVRVNSYCKKTSMKKLLF